MKSRLGPKVSCVRQTDKQSRLCLQRAFSDGTHNVIFGADIEAEQENRVEEEEEQQKDEGAQEEEKIEEEEEEEGETQERRRRMRKGGGGAEWDGEEEEEEELGEETSGGRGGGGTEEEEEGREAATPGPAESSAGAAKPDQYEPLAGPGHPAFQVEAASEGHDAVLTARGSPADAESDHASASEAQLEGAQETGPGPLAVASALPVADRCAPRVCQKQSTKGHGQPQAGGSHGAQAFLLP
eukprot:976078-Rhodomonas_salina.1